MSHTDKRDGQVHSDAAPTPQPVVTQSSNGIFSPPVKEKASQILDASVRASISFGKAVARFTRNSKAAYDEAQARRRAAAAETERLRKIELFKSTLRQLEENSAFINPKSLQVAKDFEQAVGGNVDALAIFASDDRVRRLLDNASNRAAFALTDQEMQARAYEFEVMPDELFKAIGENNVSPILKTLVQKYSVSNSGNIVAGTVLASRKNYGGLALAMADSVKTGAHNGKVKTTFTEHIRYVRYIRSGINMNDTHRAYTILANRLAYLGIGDASIVGRALFSLVYDNGNAAFSPPQPPTTFSSSLHGEFHNNFLGYLWTVHQAAAQIDLIRAKHPLAEELFGLKDIAPVLQRFTDPVPNSDEILSQVTRNT